jgi:hypothetical protein
VPLPYYSRLPPRAQAIYRASAAIPAIVLPNPELAWPFVDQLRRALAEDSRDGVKKASIALAGCLTEMLGVPPLEVEVHAVRPTLRASELHGLYTRDDGRKPRVEIWMRTARLGKVVAFRTFLRTLLHEVSHHLDYTHLRLEDSLHTEGFFKRESSLLRQVTRPGEGRDGTTG